MYRQQYALNQKEAIYIAGPECFYTHGYEMLAAMRMRAQSLGFRVTLPNDHPLDLENPDLQKQADSIFADLDHVMKETTAIISDLEAYRGAEPDSGTVYEIGMAYALGLPSYGYTRDKRSLASKNQGAFLKDGKVCDERGKQMPYAQLPFAPSIMGSTRVVEGDFDDCLKAFMNDIEQSYIERSFCRQAPKLVRPAPQRTEGRPLVYLAGFERYDEDGREIYEEMKALCAACGMDASSPLDWAPGVEKIQTDNPYVWAGNVFDNYQQQVRNCDIIIANLNDYRGYEVNNDVGFECGMGFELGKKLYGYMDDAGPLIGRVPHLGAAREFRDQSGSNVENFNYPANLMFACSMDIREGSFAQVLPLIAEDLKNDR